MCRPHREDWKSFRRAHGVGERGGERRWKLLEQKKLEGRELKAFGGNGNKVCWAPRLASS